MSVAHRLANYLSLTHTDYRLLSHTPTQSAADSAQAAHLANASVVKSILLRDSQSGRYLLALTPASNRLKMGWVISEGSGEFVMAKEEELHDLFPDCSVGAVPGFGQAYDLDMIWDEELALQSMLYFEAGNHQELIQIEHDEFAQLFGPYPHAAISLPHENYAHYHADELRGASH